MSDRVLPDRVETIELERLDLRARPTLARGQRLEFMLCSLEPGKIPHELHFDSPFAYQTYSKSLINFYQNYLFFLFFLNFLIDNQLKTNALRAFQGGATRNSPQLFSRKALI